MTNPISLSETEKAKLQEAFDLIRQTPSHERPIIYARLAKKLKITQGALKDCYGRYLDQRISDRSKQEFSRNIK